MISSLCIKESAGLKPMYMQSDLDDCIPAQKQQRKHPACQSLVGPCC